jgi:hypothetical protein
VLHHLTDGKLGIARFHSADIAAKARLFKAAG